MEAIKAANSTAIKFVFTDYVNMTFVQFYIGVALRVSAPHLVYRSDQHRFGKSNSLGARDLLWTLIWLSLSISNNKR